MRRWYIRATPTDRGGPRPCQGQQRLTSIEGIGRIDGGFQSHCRDVTGLQGALRLIREIYPNLACSVKCQMIGCVLTLRENLCQRDGGRRRRPDVIKERFKPAIQYRDVAHDHRVPRPRASRLSYFPLRGPSVKSRRSKTRPDLHVRVFGNACQPNPDRFGERPVYPRLRL